MLHIPDDFTKPKKKIEKGYRFWKAFGKFWMAFQNTSVFLTYDQLKE